MNLEESGSKLGDATAIRRRVKEPPARSSLFMIKHHLFLVHKIGMLSYHALIPYL